MKTTASSAPLARSSLAIALCLGCAATPSYGVATTPMRQDRAAPVDLRVVCADGPRNLASLRGRAVLLVAFTTENLASQVLLRNVDRVAAAHPDDLTALALAGDRMEPRDLALVLATYREVAGLRHVEMCGVGEEVRAGESDLGRIDVVPTLFLLNRAGGVARRETALPSVADLEAMVAPALPPGR
jgi:hypothetical protein